MPTDYYIGSRKVSKAEYEANSYENSIVGATERLNRERAVQANRRAGRRLRKRQSSLINTLFKGTATIAVLVLFLNFWSPEGEVQDFDTTRVDSYRSINTTQAAMVNNFISYAETRVAGNNRTIVDLSEAYVDAAGIVPTFNSATLQTYGSTNLLYNVGSPTGEYDQAHAFVVNYSLLLQQEYEDIKAFEVDVLGVSPSSYRETSEYIKEFAQVSNSVSTGHYSVKDSQRPNNNSDTQLQCAVGPAILVRDWYSNENVLAVFDNTASQVTAGFSWTSAYKDWYVDAMLVSSEEDYDKYMNGEDVEVTYVRFNGTGMGGKGHCYPWGVNQTFIGKTSVGLGTCQAVVNSDGTLGMLDSAVKYSSKFGSNGAESLQFVYEAAVASNKWVYWFPSLEAEPSDYNVARGSNGNKFGADLTYYRVYKNQTAGIFETHPGACNAVFQDGGLFDGYYLVGILVYADQDSWTP